MRSNVSNKIVGHFLEQKRRSFAKKGKVEVIDANKKTQQIATM
jgi:hypothetical protein